VTSYVLDNAAGEASQRFSALEACLDGATMRHLAATGLGPGWRCLEVGGGGGSIGRWLSAQVGESGNVLVTDIDPRWMDGVRDGNLEIRCHDIVHDELPEIFDLIHARLVLIHLPERRQVLRRLISALRPGGWIVLEEFDPESLPITVLGDASARERFHKGHDAMMGVIGGAGVDYGWGRSLYRVLREERLVDVGAEGSTRMWTGGSAWAGLFLANTDQLQKKMIATGDVTAADLDAFRSVLRDPGVAFNSYLTVSAWGRRPPTAPPQ
jgi:SAM-dependent methyltransferase